MLIQQIEKQLKKNNLINSIKWFFKPIYKETLYINVWLDKKIIDIILTEDDFKDPKRKLAIYKKLWIDVTTTKYVTISTNYYKNFFDLFNKNLSLDTIILLLKTVGRNYQLGITNIKPVIKYLDLPVSLKKELVIDFINALNKYNFPNKQQIIAKLKTLEWRTIEDKGKGFLELAEELEAENRIKKELKKKMVMPLFITLFSIGIFVMTNEYLFPVILESFWKDNKELVQQITNNFVYVSYHYIKSNWLFISLIFIILAIIIYFLRQIYYIRLYFTKFLLKIPIIKDIIKYKEFINFLNNIINVFKYNLNNQYLYNNLQNTANIYYASKFFNYDNVINLEKLVEILLKNDAIPKIEGSQLLMLISNSGWYQNIKLIEKLKEQTISEYIKKLNLIISIFSYFVLWISAILVLIVLLNVYGGLYDSMNKIK